MIKTKTFALKKSTGYAGVEEAAEELDDMIKEFIEEKTAENTSFKVINIQFSQTTATSGDSLHYWFPAAMLVYDEA